MKYQKDDEGGAELRSSVGVSFVSSARGRQFHLRYVFAIYLFVINTIFSLRKIGVFTWIKCLRSSDYIILNNRESSEISEIC